MTNAIEPQLLSVSEAQIALGLGRRAIYTLMAQSELESVKVGSRRLIPTDAISDYVARLRSEGEETA